MFLAILAVVVLILINALYVAAEFGSVAVRRAQIARLAHEGNKKAARLLPFVQEAPKLDTYVAACQIGITASSLVLGAFADAAFAPQLARLFGRHAGLAEAAAYPIAAAAVLVLLTGLQVLFGELLPKSLALRYPLSTALRTIRPMTWSLLIFKPFIHLLNGTGIFLLRVLHVPFTAHRHIHSPKEIESMLLQSRRSGIIAPEQYQRLREALRLPLRKAHQLMVPRTRVDAIDVTWPLSRSIDVILSSPYTRLAVYDRTRDNLLGFVHAKEVAARYAQGLLESLRELVHPAVIVPEVVSVDRLLQLFREGGSHLAFIIDELGDFVGLISIDDVLSVLLGGLPDEAKHDTTPQHLPGDRVRLPGRMRRELAAELLGTDWKGEADTVSGHVVNTLGRLPKEGDTLHIGRASVTVEAVHNNVVASVIVRTTDADTLGVDPR